MTKLWCIAIAMGGPEDGMVVVSTQMNGFQDMAVAQAVSDVYRQTGTKLSLMGVNARELTREHLEAALRAMDEEEQRPPSVVQLVPRSETVCPKCGASGGEYPTCTVCGASKDTPIMAQLWPRPATTSAEEEAFARNFALATKPDEPA